MSLADTQDGTTVTIERFIDNHDLLVYLHDTPLKIGQQVTVLKHDPFEGPVTVSIQKTGEEIPAALAKIKNG
ncbi:ferrous iron transport protein A, partial [Klebsiella pneumoniae]|nr:ferrous iron transport protein A [Klebsiella pneumoniae]